MNKKISKLDDNFNKLLVCGNCENSRFNLIKINEYIPEFQDNFAKYINDLNQAYLEKKMTYCSGYPMQVTGMVNKVTNSKIKINASPVSKAMKTELWKLNDVKFVINDYEGVPCACCGQVTITHEQKMKILAEMENATDFQELRLIMEKNKKIIRPKFLPIVNNFQEILMKNPLISDSKMMDRLRTETRKEVRDALAETLNKIRNATLKSDLNLFDRELVNEYLSEVPISFKEQKSEEQFKHKYGEIMSKTLCKVVSSKRQVLINIANKDLNSVYTMRAKLYPPTELIKNWNSEVLAVFEGIIKSSIATKDHLQSKHMKGPDKIQNLATLCKDCNKEKGDDYFDVWYKKHPEFKVNYPKYLKKVKEILKENYHPEYKDYISENIQQIYYISHHELDFRAPIKSE